MSLAERWAHLSRGLDRPCVSEPERVGLKRAFYAGAAALYNELSEVPIGALEPQDPPMTDEQYTARLLSLRAELHEFAAELKAGIA